MALQEREGLCCVVAQFVLWVCVGVCVVVRDRELSIEL